LKPLRKALADGDSIYGLIRATAENHGGRAHSLTSPNGLAQEELIKTAYRRAGIPAESVGYIEAHGTGTELGDPVEINALKRAFRALYEESDRAPAEATCGLGSVKTNVGHLEAAAGIAGVIKVLLAMKHRQLPASLHCEELNPYIDLVGSPFYVVRGIEERESREYSRFCWRSSIDAFRGTFISVS
jgi:polyketide synthase PksN